MTLTSNKVSPQNAGRAFQGDAKERVAELQAKTIELLCQAFAVANLAQFPRKRVAFGLGLSTSAIDSVVRLAGRQSLTGANLVGLLCLSGDAAALPDVARHLLWQKLGEMGGMVCVPADAAKLDKSPVQQQVCEIVSECGRLAGVAAETCYQAKVGQQSADQLLATQDACHAVSRQVAELLAAIDAEVMRRRANGGAGGGGR